MFDNVVLRASDTIAFGYWRFRSRLPVRIRSSMEQLLGVDRPTIQHLNRIEELGQAIGLERNEIRAAIDHPLDSASSGTTDRTSLLDRMICRVICVVILLAVLVVVIYTATRPVYGFATRYGSISPNDFK
jgi:hypothetical protein